MSLEFKQLKEAPTTAIIDLMNNPLVRRQMPLLKGEFTEAHCKAFIKTKEQLWLKDGYGPWAFFVEGNFAGWGGLQNEDGEADLALVLHPRYWGLGKKIYQKVIEKAFGEMKLPSLTILFPPTRTRVSAILRLGFKAEGEQFINNQRFIRYRLNNPN
jgi:RimJ/RimL family protein N-acetyltransferase